MRFGNFSLLIPEGREVNSGHVEIGHGTVYTLRLGNHDHSRQCDAYVMVDGKDVGAFRVYSGQTITIERPIHDTGRFTFFKSGSQEAVQANEGSVSADNRGVVTVVFKPERARRLTPTVMRSRAGGQSCGSYEREEKTSGGIDLRCASPTSKGMDDHASNFAPGVTGLSGQSNQSFYTVENLDYDPSLEVTINLRLVAGTTVRELTPACKGNSVPAPV